MVQNKLIRAAANGVCGEPVMINRLLDNGPCFALGYEVMSRLCFLRRRKWACEMEDKQAGKRSGCAGKARKHKKKRCL